MPADQRRLRDFEGRWTLSRAIEHADGTVARFDGQAHWAPEGINLTCVESGLLTIAGRPSVAATRTYIWHADLTVRFDDGRSFHRVPPAGGDTGHWCDPDQYDGHYDFGCWPDFQVRWRVFGPRKNYTMVSRYSRMLMP